MEDNQNECQIIEIPVDENINEEVNVDEPLKPRKRKTMTDAQRAKASANLARAREIARKNRENTKKLREQIKEEYIQRDETDEDEDNDPPQPPVEKLPRRCKKTCPSKKEEALQYAYHAMKIEKKRNKENYRVLSPRKKYLSEEDYSDNDVLDDGWDSPEPKIGRPKKSSNPKPKMKKISEKDIRLALLEKKLDEIIEHTRKMQVAPKVKNTKTTVIQMPAKQPDKQDIKLAKAAGSLLSLF
jgi:hypothetical protein